MIDDRCDEIINRFSETIKSFYNDEKYIELFSEFVLNRTEEFKRNNSDITIYEEYIKDEILGYLKALYDSDKEYFLNTKDETTNNILDALNDTEKLIHMIVIVLMPIDLNYNIDKSIIIKNLGLNETEYESLIAEMTKKSIDVLNENSAWPKIYSTLVPSLAEHSVKKSKL